MVTRILLADDHPVVRSGIRNELKRNAELDVVGEAADGDEALRLSKVLCPDVLVLDINMPGLKAIRVIRELRAEHCRIHILILTAYSDRENIVGMLHAGATGYLLKDEDPSRIVEAVQAVAQGRTWLSAAVAESLVSQATGEVVRSVLDQLSEREVEVLRWIAHGYSNPQIAETLCISEGTVKNHVTSIYDRLGVHSRAEAVVWAWQHRLVKDS